MLPTLPKGASALAALLMATALAGCAHPPAVLDPAAEHAYSFGGFHYPYAQALSDNGTPLPTRPALLDAPHLPVLAHRVIAGLGGEPSAGATQDRSLFVISLDQVYRSTDQGRTWTPVYAFHSPEAPMVSNLWTTADPYLWVDPATDRVYVVQMQGTYCFYVTYSDDHGATWSAEKAAVPVAPGAGACEVPLVDHPKLVTGKPGPASVLKPVGYANMVYLCYNKVVYGVPSGSFCQSSYDGGATWPVTTQALPPCDGFYNGTLLYNGCPTINGAPAVAPDGTLVVPAGTIGGVHGKDPRPPTVAVSADSGLTWSVRACDACPLQRGVDPDITFTPDGTAYYAYTGPDAMTYLLRSKDRFATWEGPFRLTPHGQVFNVFSAITSGDDGRIAVAFLGTDTPQPDSGGKVRDAQDAIGGTVWHLFVAVSQDAASAHPTFVTQQVTPNESPVQVGCVWLSGGASRCRNLLDFIDAGHDADGRLFVAFTDGCSPRAGCATDADSADYQSQDHDVAMAIQDSGASLFAAKGDLPTLGLERQPPRDAAAHHDGGAP